MGSSRLRFKHLVISALLYYSPSNAICYWPNGDVTAMDVACENGQSDSACCSPGFTCLANGLCMHVPHDYVFADDIIYVRSSCTDQSWKSSDCPNYCVRGDAPYGDTLNGTQPMGKCNGSDIEYYCKDGVGGGCTSTDNILTIFPADTSGFTTIGIQSTTTVESESTSTSTYYITSSSMSITTSASSSLSSSTSGPTTSGPTSTLDSQTTSSSSATIVPSKQSSNSESVGLGAGLGIPLGLLVLGLAGWVLMKKRRKGAKYSPANRPISELPVEESRHEVPQPKHWRREELSGDSWAPSELAADP